MNVSVNAFTGTEYPTSEVRPPAAGGNVVHPCEHLKKPTYYLDVRRGEKMPSESLFFLEILYTVQKCADKDHVERKPDIATLWLSNIANQLAMI